MGYFNAIAKNDLANLHNELIDNPHHYFFNPYQSYADLTWAGLSIVILPVYYFGLALLLCLEALFLVGHSIWHYSSHSLNDSYFSDGLASVFYSINASALTSVIGLVVLCAFISRLLATATNQMRKINYFFQAADNDRRMHSRRAQEDDELDGLIDMCDRQLIIQSSELDIINDAVNDLNQELIQFNRKVESYTAGMVLFQPEIMQNHQNQEQSVDKSQLAEARRMISELLHGYPHFPDINNITSELLKEFYDKSVEHHAQVLEAFLYYIPEMHTQLNIAYKENPECFHSKNYRQLS